MYGLCYLSLVRRVVLERNRAAKPHEQNGEPLRRPQNTASYFWLSRISIASRIMATMKFFMIRDLPSSA
jgi:hypothetical protein